MGRQLEFRLLLVPSKPSVAEANPSAGVLDAASRVAAGVPENVLEATAPTGFSKLSEEEVASGPVFRVTKAVFGTPNGDQVVRDIVRHAGAVAVVALDEDDTVVLLRQYRTPLENELVEIPAGKRDVDGEDPSGTARRELAEEAGLACESLVELARFYNSPGFCNEFTHIYLGTGLSQVPSDPGSAEEESMTVERMSLDEALTMIDTGEIHDAKTIIGLLLAARRLGR